MTREPKWRATWVQCRHTLLEFCRHLRGHCIPVPGLIYCLFSDVLSISCGEQRGRVFVRAPPAASDAAAAGVDAAVEGHVVDKDVRRVCSRDGR